MKLIKMKRFLLLLTCICLVLSGCKKSTKVDPQESVANENAAVTDTKVQDEGIAKDVVNDNNAGDAFAGSDKENNGMLAAYLKLDKSWSLVKEVQEEIPEFTLPAYTANVQPYKIAKDLSNVENLYRFDGFTDEQKKMLARNGFIVLPGGYTKAYYVYDNNEYAGVPSFVTSDVILHIYHQFYDKSLMSIEANYLYDDLDMMTRQMLDKSILLLKQLKDEDLKAIQKKNIAYFMVARMLFTQSDKLDIQMDEADKDILELAKREYALAQDAAGIEKSPLFKHDIDYSQFTVRGHYTRSEELNRFFKTMMWFGLIPMELINKNEVIQYDNIYQALLISYMTVADSEDVCDAQLWTNIYKPTSSYVGLSDDINVFVMNGLRIEVFGENSVPDDFNDEQYHDILTKAVKALPRPRIQGKLTNSDTPTGLQFRYMGQRYVLDSEILQELMKPILRPVPTALDVCGVLGSNTAEKLLFEEYKPQESWPDYTEVYNKLKSTVSAYDKKYWQSNLYNGWLWSIQSVIKEYDTDSGMPFFMTTDAWKYKSLNAALGSYTELKHDTVLYSKQAVAEMGGPLDYPDMWHYVEPNVELYAKLKYLTSYTCSVLDENGMLSQRLKYGADEYIDLLQLLIDCSIKELRNESLSEEEYTRLLRVGGTLETICHYFMPESTDDSYEPINDPTDMLVTDIATVESMALSIGTGYFDDIYVVIPHEGKLYLTRGCTYSFYEFLSSKRLTDEEWWRMQGIIVERGDYGFYVRMEEPSKDLPEQPEWTSKFKSNSNKVEVKEQEIDWSRLEE